MNDQQLRHVFISYVRENQEQVDRLCQELEQHGVKVWLDRKSIKPGARWKDAIREAIRHGDFFIACFSEEYTSKTRSYMNEELTLAIEELRQYASDREWFIPVLLSECDVPARSIGAGETLLDINWVPLYEDWNDSIKRILSVIKPIPPEIQNLISALRSDDRVVRQQAANALGKTGDPDAVPPLIRALKDEDKDVRWKAAQALGEIGPDAKAAVPALIEALQDENPEVRMFVAVSLGILGPDAKAAVPDLVEMLEDKDKTAQAVEEIGTNGKSFLGKLFEIFTDQDDWIRSAVEWALEEMNTPEARKALEEYKQKSK
ncbi:MAG: HEAT repeat domain-containing protein [Desulfobacterales bacterium]|jgi:hypothetical protein